MTSLARDGVLSPLTSVCSVTAENLQHKNKSYITFRGSLGINLP